MSTPAIVMVPDVPVTVALGFMELRKVRSLPVVDHALLVGIVSVTDVLGAVNRRARPETTVGEIMTRRPITVAPGDTVERAAELMLARNISGLPVVDRGRVVGMITRTDLIAALRRAAG